MKKIRIFQKKTRKLVARLFRKEGSIINLALLVLVLLNVIVIGVSKIASTNVKIATNDKVDKIALMHAESGIDEAIARLQTFANDTIQPAAQTYDPAWRGFIGVAANATDEFSYDAANTKHHLLASAQTGNIDYTVQIRKKLEAELPDASAAARDRSVPADGDDSDVLVWDYADSSLEARNNGASIESGLFFIYILNSRATFDGVDKEVEVEIISENDMVVPANALFANKGVDATGGGGLVSGAENNPPCATVPDIATSTEADPVCTTTTESVKTRVGHSWEYVDTPVTTCTDDLSASTYTGKTAGTYDESTAPIDLASQAATLCAKDSATTIPASIDKAGDPYGSAVNYDGIFCTDPSVSSGELVGNNLDGYGILVVRGDFVVKGNIGWEGIIIVTGTTTLEGGGKLAVEGAIMSDGLASVQGSPDVYYNCEVINRLMNGPSVEREITRWQDF